MNENLLYFGKSKVDLNEEYIFKSLKYLHDMSNDLYNKKRRM
jgi:hypothetical protein